MARPKKAVVDYFPHYVSHGKTMFTLETKFGKDGYCFWFKLLELLGETEQHFIDCNDEEVLEYMLAKTLVSEDVGCNILDLLAKLNAIDKDLWNQKVVWSLNFVKNLDVVYSRREINVYTKEDIQGLCKQKHPLNGIIDNINPQSKVKESKAKESKVFIADSERLWKLYPLKNGKQEAMKKIPKLIEKYTMEQMERTVSNYMEFVKFRRSDGFKDLNYQDGKTFFNKGYVDYLDENYEELKQNEKGGYEYDNSFNPSESL